MMVRMLEANRRRRILIIDDDELIIQSLRARLESEGFEVLGASSGTLGVERFREGVDGVLLDLALPDIGGEEVFRRLRLIDPTVPVIMMTGHSTVTNAVQMMKAGLFHYVEKSADYMGKVVQEVRAATQSRVRAPRPNLPEPSDLIGTSSDMRRLRQELSELVSNSAPVLVVGERGTGKRLVADILHYGGARRAAPLIVIDCSSLEPSALERQLFGEESAVSEGRPGALELARGGTVVLEQVEHLAHAQQTKLLEYIETTRFLRYNGTLPRTSTARIVSTSASNLKADVGGRGFSNPLRLALGGHRPLEVPPLRERPEDIPGLAGHFLEELRVALGRPMREIAPDAMACLVRQPWPGNVLELRNLVERAVLLSGDHTRLTEADLIALSEHAATQGFLLPNDGVQLEELEKSLVLQALSRTRKNRTQAGKLLGLNRDQVRYRIKKFDIDENELDDSASKQPAT